jgi:hypothetical protein
MLARLRTNTRWITCQSARPWANGAPPVSPTGDDFGSGWINSIALIGSDIVQVEPLSDTQLLVIK